MTRKTKQELIAQVVALLDALIEVEDQCSDNYGFRQGTASGNADD